MCRSALVSSTYSIFSQPTPTFAHPQLLSLVDRLATSLADEVLFRGCAAAWLSSLLYTLASSTAADDANPLFWLRAAGGVTPESALWVTCAAMLAASAPGYYAKAQPATRFVRESTVSVDALFQTFSEAPEQWLVRVGRGPVLGQAPAPLPEAFQLPEDGPSDGPSSDEEPDPDEYEHDSDDEGRGAAILAARAGREEADAAADAAAKVAAEQNPLSISQLRDAINSVYILTTVGGADGLPNPLSLEGLSVAVGEDSGDDSSGSDGEGGGEAAGKLASKAAAAAKDGSSIGSSSSSSSSSSSIGSSSSGSGAAADGGSVASVATARSSGGGDAATSSSSSSSGASAAAPDSKKESKKKRDDVVLKWDLGQMSLKIKATINDKPSKTDGASGDSSGGKPSAAALAAAAGFGERGEAADEVEAESDDDDESEELRARFAALQKDLLAPFLDSNKSMGLRRMAVEAAIRAQTIGTIATAEDVSHPLGVWGGMPVG